MASVASVVVSMHAPSAVRGQPVHRLGAKSASIPSSSSSPPSPSKSFRMPVVVASAEAEDVPQARRTFLLSASMGTLAAMVIPPGAMAKPKEEGDGNDFRSRKVQGTKRKEEMKQKLEEVKRKAAEAEKVQAAGAT